MYLKNYVRLAFQGRRLKARTLKSLAPLDKLEVLTVDVEDLGELPAFGKLRTLKVGDGKLTDAGLKELPKLGSLHELDLAGTRVTDAGLGQVARLRGLQKLSLTDDRVTDAGVRELAVLKDLRELSLLNCKDVSDDSMRYLARWCALKRFTSALRASPIRDSRNFDR